MKIRLLFLIILTMSWASLCVPAWAGVNLLTNPNFELDAGSSVNLTARATMDNVLDWNSWHGSEGVEPTLGTHPTADMQGNIGDGGSEASIWTTWSVETLLAGTVYHLEVDVKSTDGLPATVDLVIEDGDWPTKAFEEVLSIETLAIGWKSYTFTLDTSSVPEAVGKWFSIGARSGIGSAASTNWYFGEGPRYSGDLHTPSPGDGDTIVAGPLTLSWGNNGVQTNTIYWNNGSANVNDGNFDTHGDVVQIGTTDQAANSVGGLTSVTDKNYLWRVVHDDGEVPGPLWHFTTVNQLPNVEAGPKQSKWLPASGTIEALFLMAPTVSDDILPDPHSLIYLWEDVGATDNVIFSNSGVLAPTVTIDTAGDYTLELTVDDGGGTLASDTVVIRVHANDTTGLEARYDFDERAKPNVFNDDYSGNDHEVDRMADGVKQSKPNFAGTFADVDGGHGAPACDYGGGPEIGAVRFIESEIGYLQCPDSSNDPNLAEPPAWADFRDEVTIMAWIKVDPTAGEWDDTWENIIAKGNTSYRLQRNNGGDGVSMVVNGPSPNTAAGTIPVNDGAWHHVAGTYDGVYICIYVDGVQDVCVETDGAQIAWDDQVDLTIGHNLGDTSSPFGGMMDEVRVYSIGLPHRSDEPEVAPTPENARSIVSLFRVSCGHHNCGGRYEPGDVDEDCDTDFDDALFIIGDWMNCTDIGNPDCEIFRE